MQNGETRGAYMESVPPYDRPDRVIVLGGQDRVKTASLYFDHVIPLSFLEYPRAIFPPEFQPGREMGAYKAFQTGLLGVLKATGGEKMICHQPQLNQVERLFDKMIREQFPHFKPVSVDAERGDPHIAEAYLQNTLGTREKILKRLAGIGLERVPLLVPDGALLGTNATLNDITITLAKMPLVDISKASWEQVLEFRKDLRARAKLRRLRLFLYDNYSGRSSQYIQDSILSDLDNHMSSCLKHGFEFKTGTLSTVLDSKMLLTTGIITFMAFLFGGPSTGLITAAIGSSIEIGKVLLTIADKQHGLAQLKDSHPLAYIIEVAENLSEAENGQAKPPGDCNS